MAKQRSQVRMSPEEVDTFLASQRTVTMCTMHPSGSIHAVAMWYAFLDGALAVETKTKSQKVQNLRRDPRMTCLVESGDRYENLQGVELVGVAEIIDGPPKRLFEFGVSMWERYIGPYTADDRSGVEVMMSKRVVIRLDIARTVSWDHRKLA